VSGPADVAGAFGAGDVCGVAEERVTGDLGSVGLVTARLAEEADAGATGTVMEAGGGGETTAESAAGVRSGKEGAALAEAAALGVVEGAVDGTPRRSVTATALPASAPTSTTAATARAGGPA
jgi:hypothetical protein